METMGDALDDAFEQEGEDEGERGVGECGIGRVGVRRERGFGGVPTSKARKGRR